VAGQGEEEAVQEETAPLEASCRGYSKALEALNIDQSKSTWKSKTWRVLSEFVHS
jgi:hypothetical protein